MARPARPTISARAIGNAAALVAVGSVAAAERAAREYPHRGASWLLVAAIAAAAVALGAAALLHSSGHRRAGRAGLALFAIGLGLFMLIGLAFARYSGGGGGIEGRPLRRRGRLIRGRGTSAAYNEHASVPAFAETSLMLAAVGAPLTLIQRCHDAALDEIRHARSAARLDGIDVEKVRLPALLGRRVGSRSRTRTLLRLAVDSLRDGCGEARAAEAAVASASAATDPARRAHFAMIAADETRHAALAADIVRFAMAEGGPGVAFIVSRAARVLRSPVSASTAAPAMATSG